MSDADLIAELKAAAVSPVDTGGKILLMAAKALEVRNAEVTALREVIEKTKALHVPIEAVNYFGGKPRPAKVCSGCGTDDGNWATWPCPTVKALSALVASPVTEEGN